MELSFICAFVHLQGLLWEGPASSTEGTCPCLSGMCSLVAERDPKQIIARVIGDNSGKGQFDEGEHEGEGQEWDGNAFLRN